MQDACMASKNAATAVFSDECIVTMCFFHVMHNVKNKLFLLDKKHHEKMKKSIFDLHMCRSYDEYSSKLLEFKSTWDKSPTKRFFDYFNSSWLEGNFSNWQIFHNPIGFACTNSPIESFNSQIKAAFTNRKLLSVMQFLKKMIEIVQFYSLNDAPFQCEFPVPKNELQKAKAITKANFEKIANGKFKYKNTYTVNTEEIKCQCRVFFKWGNCAHLSAANRLMVAPEVFAQKNKRGRIPLAKKALLRD